MSLAEAAESSHTKLFRFPYIGIALASILLAIRVLTNWVVPLNLPVALQDMLTLSASVIIEALPFVLLGILLSIVVQVWLPENILFRILPKRTGPRRLALSFFGIFLPVCECGNIPLARGLMIKGLSVSESLTFLLAAPILNPITIVTTQQAFGSDGVVLIARLAGGLLIANLVGWLFSSYKKDQHLLTSAFAKSCQANHHDHSSSHHSRLAKSLETFTQEAGTIMPALIFGGFMAGLIQVLIPREILFSLGGHVVWSVFAMMALAFIISICASVDAFFALAFSNSFTTGALVSFLVFGPIVDIKILNLMRTTYRPQVLVTVAGITALISLTLGLVVNYAF